jgi:integrase
MFPFMARNKRIYTRKIGTKYQAEIRIRDTATGKVRRLTKLFPTESEATAWGHEELKRWGPTRSGALSMTFAELLDDWWGLRSPKWSANTRQTNFYIVRKLKADIGAMPIASMTAYDFDKYIIALTRDGRSATTIKRYFNVIRASMNQAVKWDRIPNDPSKKADVPKEPPRKKITPISPDTIEEIIDEAYAHTHEFGDMVAVAVATGMRLGEVLGLRWGDIDFETSTIHCRHALAEDIDGTIVVKPPKNGKERDIPIGGTTLALLKRRRTAWKTALVASKHRHKDGFVFAQDPLGQQPRRTDYPTQAFTSVRNILGYDEIHFHSLRHYHISRLIEAGFDHVTVAERVGHSPDGRMTLGRYAHPSSQRNRDAAALFDNDLRRLAGE